MANTTRAKSSPKKAPAAKKTTASRSSGLKAVATAGGPDIVIKAVRNKRKKITVELIGTLYKVNVPKTAMAMRFAQFAQMFGDEDEDDMSMEALTEMQTLLDEWVDQVFSKEGATDVRARLENPEDDLDFEHLMDLLGELSGFDSDNPPM